MNKGHHCGLHKQAGGGRIDTSPQRKSINSGGKTPVPSKMNREPELSCNHLKPNSSLEIFPKSHLQTPDSFLGKFFLTFKDETAPVLLDLFQNTEEETLCPSWFVDSVL